MNRKKIIQALRNLGITFDGQASTTVLNGLLRGTWLTVRNDAEGGDYDFEMNITGVIGATFYGDEGYSAKQFQDELKPFGAKRGLVCIHSPGGNVWDGFAIAELIRSHGNIDTKILGVAASAADVIFQSGRNRVMPRASERMGHNTSGYMELYGNAKDIEAAKPEVDKLIGRLQKHDETLAKMYADRSGQSLADVKADMDAEEFMDGDESLEKGYCDQLSDDAPIENAFELNRLKGFPTAILNHFSATSKQGAAKPNPEPKPQDLTVNKTQKIALLNKWGVKLPADKTAETITDAWLDEQIDKGKPAEQIGREQNIALLNKWGVKFEATITDADLEALVSKGKPAAAPANGNGNNGLDEESKKAIADFKKQRDDMRRDTLRNRITQFSSEERIPANQIEDWVNYAFAATDDPVKGNPIIASLAALQSSQGPGVPRLPHIEGGLENLTVAKLDKVVCDLLKPTESITRNGQRNPSNEVRRDIATNSKRISQLVNQLRKVDGNGMLIGPLRDAWDAWAAGVQNANTMSASLLRQVILSELMRAFRRNFASLNIFAHNYKDVALQGTDKVEVLYYPLDQVASTEFTQGAGYVIGANAVTSNKEIQVGGKGDGVASAGRGRKYKPLAFSAYEIARQPWLNIAQLIVMAAEQLAIDVRGDILGTQITQANFGNAIWTGAAGAFDSNVVAQYLRVAATKAFWPMGMRNAVMIPEFYANLASDPYVKAFLNIGSTDTIRDGKIGGLYGFQEMIEDVLLPIANFIRGGDGNVTAGADPNLAGFIAYPSAILIATAPIMPGPATMKLLASYEQVTDDQTGLTFSYQYFGNVLGSQDAEIIECTYGSGLGELAALKRFTTAGQ